MNDRAGGGGAGRRFAPLLRSLDAHRRLVRRAISAAAAGEPVARLATGASILPTIPASVAVDLAADPVATAAAAQTWRGLLGAEAALHEALDAADNADAIDALALEVRAQLTEMLAQCAQLLDVAHDYPGAVQTV
ncbi:MAG: hypothetical protein NTW37_00925, partial [Proteobacteria bacterium]|nr:hypothetical protein [Pseudomonadota bacterium]